MAYTTINKSSLHQNAVLYTGNDSAGHSITGVGFQPDLWWNKSRSGTHSAGVHCLYDSVRGVTKRLKSNSSDAEETISGVTAFGTDGVTLGSENQSNGDSTNYVAWNWKAGGAASSNSDGTITTSVSANTTSGFSILTYSGTGSGGGTIGHGLGAKPKVFICRHLNAAGNNWQVWVDTTGDGTSDQRLLLNGIGSNYNNNHITFGTSTITLPSSDSDAWSGSGKNYVGYAFLEKIGYSKYGLYEGNNSSSDNCFIYTGFKPKFLIIKNTDADADWVISDYKRNPINPRDDVLLANSSVAEQDWSSYPIDILSNGFKIRNNGQGTGTSHTFLYIAFGQSLVGSNNIPCTAR